MAEITVTVPLVDEYTVTPSRNNPSTFFEDRETRLSEEATRIPQQNSQATALNTFKDEANALRLEVNEKALIASSLQSATATATQVSSTTPATVTYDSVLNKFSFEIPQGTNGIDGADGADGATGNGILNITQISGDGSAGTTDTYQVNFTNGTSYQFSIYNGANGLSGSGTGDLVAAANLSDVSDRATSLNNLLPSQVGKSGYTLQTVDNVPTWVEVDTVPTTPTPVLSGNTSANENTDTVITVVNYDATATYTPQVTSGSVVNNGDGTFTISLPDYDVAQSVTFTLTANRVGENTSAIASFGITVIEVLIPVITKPILTGAISGVENSLVVITATNYDANNTYFPSVTAGSVINNNNGTFSITLPDFSATTSITFSLYATRDGYQTSQTATQNISVTNTILATPTITGATSANEETTTIFTITNYDSTQTYFASVNFGSVVNNGNGTFNVTLPAYATSTSVTFSVYATRASDIDSSTGTFNINVIELTIEFDDTTIIQVVDFTGEFEELSNLTIATSATATADGAYGISFVYEQEALDGDFVDNTPVLEYNTPEITITTATATTITSTSHGLTGTFDIKTYSATDGLVDGSATVTGVDTIDVTSLSLTVAPTKAWEDKPVTVSTSTQTTEARIIYGATIDLTINSATATSANVTPDSGSLYVGDKIVLDGKERAVLTRTFNNPDYDITFDTTTTTPTRAYKVDNKSLTTTGTPTTTTISVTDAESGLFDDGDSIFLEGENVYTTATTVTESDVSLAYEPNTVLQLSFDNNLDDDVGTHTLTANGNATTSATQSKFGGYSLALDGAGDYLSIPTSTDFNLGSGDFTIDGWNYLTSNADTNPIISDATATPYPFMVFRVSTNNTVALFISNATRDGWAKSYNTILTVPQNTQTHLALQRSGSELAIYVGGAKEVLDASFATTIQNPDTSLYIGRYASEYYNGYIDEFRIVKGEAKYGASFTPPTAPYGDIKFKYDITHPVQTSPSTGVALPDRSKTSTEASDVYDNVNDKFVKTYNKIEQQGRAFKYRIEANNGVEITKANVTFNRKPTV